MSASDIEPAFSPGEGHVWNVHQSVVALIRADTAAEAQDFLRHRLELACEMASKDWSPPGTQLFALDEGVQSRPFHSVLCGCGQTL